MGLGGARLPAGCVAPVAEESRLVYRMPKLLACTQGGGLPCPPPPPPLASEPATGGQLAKGRLACPDDGGGSGAPGLSKGLVDTEMDAQDHSDSLRFSLDG